MRLTLDDLAVEVRFSTRRKTVELTVERDGSLTVRAPLGIEAEVLEGFVRDKQLWIYTKLAEKNALRQPEPAKAFVTGEGFKYLGRSYRLLLVDEEDVPLKLEAGRFKLLRSEVGRGRDHFVAWYKAHALPWFRRRVKLYAPQIGAEANRVEVRDLGYRWGSCGQTGGVNFNWQTILLPAGVADYVAVHEQVHLRAPNHSPEFWTRVERVLPDYKQRKEWMAANGAGFVGV
ncbi:MAG: M48 family peptidase [Myxococcales bacterium]|nr:M48 family peptidase [Myxococcales bacterium]